MAEKASEHGFRASYLQGCRCKQCKAANAEYEFARRRGTVNDARIDRLVRDAGALSPEQVERLRALLPAPSEAGT